MSGCLLCGTCCFSTSPEYVRVMGNDYSRMGDVAHELAGFIGTRAFMQMADGHCKALRIDHEKGVFLCSIYDRRPDACRDLEEESAACEGEIATKAERPQNALIALRRKS